MAFSADEGPAPTNASPNIEEPGFHSRTEARFMITTRDQGIASTAAAKVEPSTSMGLETFRIYFDKDMSPRYRSKITVNFLGGDLAGALEEAQLIYQPNRVFSIVAGKGKILQGGYESVGDAIGIALPSLYAARYFPFQRKYGSILELHTQANGDLTLQLTEDVTNQVTDQFGNRFPYFSNARKQPAVVIQWLAKFGKIVPLLQIGSYDLHHSSYISGGVEFNLSGFKVSGDLSIDNRAEKIQPADQEQAKALNHHMVNKVFQIEYTSIWQLIPFAKWTSFDIRQPVDQDLNRTDDKGNVDLTSWNDNQTSWQLGLHTIHWGTEFVPFLAFSEVSGKFYRAPGSLEIDEKAEKFAMAGVSGRF
jgi:hypothetical protein